MADNEYSAQPTAEVPEEVQVTDEVDEATLLNIRSAAWFDFIEQMKQRTPEMLKTGYIRKEELPLPDLGSKHAFQLFGVLTPEECAYLIAQTEKLGYARLSDYSRSYRSNTRVIVTHRDLCAEMWQRIKNFVPQEITPYIEGQQWTALNMNERFRFCKYEKGEHFAAHFDGQFRRSFEDQSFLTFMIYLNDVNEGGCTNFLAQKASTKRVLHAVRPVAGMALIFTHKIYHEGEILDGPIKYILRSDIMYKKQSVVVVATEADPVKTRAKLLLSKAKRLEAEGKAEESAMTWRELFKLCPEIELNQDFEGDLLG